MITMLPTSSLMLAALVAVGLPLFGVRFVERKFR